MIHRSRETGEKFAPMKLFSSRAKSSGAPVRASSSGAPASLVPPVGAQRASTLPLNDALANSSATRVQAMFRGNKHRATVAAGRAMVAAKREEPVVHSAFELVNEAATRVQAFGRGFKERKARSLERAEQEAAATKLQAARRGQTARVEYQGTVQRRHDEEFKAATLVQTSVRGRQARQTVEHRR